MSCPKAVSSWLNMPSKATNNICPADIFGVSWLCPSKLRGWISSEYWTRIILSAKKNKLNLDFPSGKLEDLFHNEKLNLVMWRQWLWPSWSRPVIVCRLSVNSCKLRPSELCSTSCSSSDSMVSNVGSPFIIQRRASGKIICRKLVFSSYNQ